MDRLGGALSLSYLLSGSRILAGTCQLPYHSGEIMFLLTKLIFCIQTSRLDGVTSDYFENENRIRREKRPRPHSAMVLEPNTIYLPSSLFLCGTGDLELDPALEI